MRVAVFLAVTIYAGLVSSVWALDAEQWFVEGNRFSAEGRFEEVKLASEDLIKSNPSPENYSILIRSIIGLGDFDGVEQIIKNL